MMATHNDKLLKDFGRQLKSLRTAKGLSIRKFADEADIAHSAVDRLESGQTNPTLTTLLKVADALGVDLNKLVPKK